MAEQNKPNTKLTPQQLLFCQEYIKDLNATKAAIRAKYSGDTAAQQGSRLLSNVKVSDYIAELKVKQFKRLQVDSDKILSELSRLGFSDIRRLFDGNGCILPIREWPKSIAAAVSSIEVKEEFMDLFDKHICEGCNRKMTRELTGYTKKLKLWSKDRGLELLGKHKKLFAERHEHSGPDGRPIELKDASTLTDEQLEARISAYLTKEK